MKIFTCFNAQITHQCSYTVQYSSTVFPFHSALIGQLTAPLTASQADSCFQISTINICINDANVSHGDVWCHKVKEIKGGNTGGAFRSSVFCGRMELLSVPSLNFLTFKTFKLHKNIYNTLTERENMIKHNMSSFIRLFHKICWVNSSCITAHFRECCLNYKQVET